MIYDFTAFRQARRDRGWTLNDAAERLGISPMSLCNIENGKVQGNVSKLMQLLELYGLDSKDVFKNKWRDSGSDKD